MNGKLLNDFHCPCVVNTVYHSTQCTLCVKKRDTFLGQSTVFQPTLVH